jgi:phosphate uptake regulator
MDQRKLIKFGSSSHVLSLPSQWLKRNNLSKGDVVYLNENNNGDLILSNDSVREDIRKVTINSDGKSFERLSKEIFSAYVNNFSVITIEGKDLIKIKEKVRKIIHGFVALEIVREDRDKVVARDFLNFRDISIDENIRRMDILVRSMMQNMMICFSGKMGLSDDIYKKDHDVNKFYHLLTRALKGAMYDPAVLKLLELSSERILPMWLLCTSLEDIGDEIKRISRFMEAGNFKGAEKKKLASLCAEAEKLYLGVMKAYYKNNNELAYRIDIDKNELIESCNKVFDKHHTPDVGRVLERLKKMLSGIGQVAKVVYEN